MRFPLPFVPTTTYKGGNGFGGDRSKVRAGLKHAANDLAAKAGTPVLAMASGKVIVGSKPFFRGTNALAIQHPDFIARYCEIAPRAEVKADDDVVEGQVIAYVGDQPGQDMLHIEFFSGAETGELSNGTPPYYRRADVFDGVKYLDDTRGTATHWADWKTGYRYSVDANGRKFVQRMDLRDI
ncbi:M23 family metallopeptidase [Enterovirga aerilata]|uniref:M23 family metallopeptidase n=1 Tax=Enterovirga aerilata TaxID=2730920 RepID=A0A849I3K3_9HYPH|nr:M23 family metallopeptidase [Enterovirga sp. DB1703]NNM70969.1 M23 family metallopeptidase [Enterovirga sp. DB1703]